MYGLNTEERPKTSVVEIADYVKAKVEVVALGPDVAAGHGLPTWSLKDFQAQEDVPAIRMNCANRKQNFAAALRKELESRGIRTAYAPSVAAMSAAIVDATALSTAIRLCGNRSDDLIVYRNKLLPADGLFLEKPGEAFVMSGAGCPIIVARNEDLALVAHAGRDSLIDRGAVLGNPTRKHLSVIHAILEAFADKGVPAEKVDMFLHFPIAQDTFGHPYGDKVHGEYNRGLKKFLENRGWATCFKEADGALFPDLATLFTIQSLEAGVNVSGVHERLETRDDLVTTRDARQQKSSVPLRNLIIAKRTH